MRRTFLAAALLLLACPAFLHAASGSGKDAAGAFLVRLQKAVAADDRRAVASMIRYPIVTWGGQRDVLIETPEALVAAYDQIFSPGLKKSIGEARGLSLFNNWQGYMIHDGEIWFDDLQPQGFKVIAINNPIGAAKHVKPLSGALRTHPKVFSLIQSWESDGEAPILTEISLDAVEQDGNQFDPSEVKQDGEWLRIDPEDGGFLRYRTLETAGNRYTVQVQQNGGGTLTTQALIELVVDKREIRKDGKPVAVRVLRVVGYRAL